MALSDEMAADIGEAISSFEESFDWEGATYPCVIESNRHALTVLKSVFPNGVYPKWGELITVAGKVRQVTRLNGSALLASSAGLVETPPFVDAPNKPALDIEFDVPIKR